MGTLIRPKYLSSKELEPLLGKRALDDDGRRGGPGLCGHLSPRPALVGCPSSSPPGGPSTSTRRVVRAPSWA